MKILQVPFCFYPDAVGGTEVYVEALAKGLQKLKEEVVIAAPADKEASYRYGEIPVRRYAVPPPAGMADLYGEGDPAAAQAAARILDEEKPDIVHLHAFTRGVSLRLAREVKRRGVPLFFTYHTPTVSCQRGTLLRWGKEICDGRLKPGLCARCTLEGRGLPRLAAEAVTRVPVPVGRWAARWASGKLATALRMRERVLLQQESFRALMQESDRIIAVCQWVYDLLLLNGVPAVKVTLCRQGLVHEVPPATGLPKSPGPQPLRVVFLGRLHPSKGAHLLVRAVRDMPRLGVRLDLYGIRQDPADAEYERSLRALAGNDPRISFSGQPIGDRVIEGLRRYDLLAAPSLGLETGPLVVLEAFGAGLPVLGSRLGGIAELVRDGVDGLLVEAGSVREWSRALRRIAEDPELLRKLRSGVAPPRTAEAVAEEMGRLYRASRLPA